MNRLKDKVALITASGSGIGRATAYLFAEEGASVAVCDINQEAGGETAAGIRSKGGRSSFFRCDVTSSKDVKEAVRATEETFGTIDIVHSHAGGVVDHPDNVLEDSEEDWVGLMNLNIKSHFLVAKEVVPIMIKNHGGAIIVTITTNAFMNYRNSQAYGTTKSALIQLVKSLALDYAANNIRVNALAPGEVLTPMWERSVPVNMRDTIKRKIPMGRIGAPEDIASCALFLASDDARYVTGNVLFVDGGLMAGFYEMSL